MHRWRALVTAVVSGLVIAGLAALLVALGETHAGSPGAAGAVDAAPVAVGGAFPHFSVTDADHTQLTNTSLGGTDTLVWFTDTNCPDTAGVDQVAALRAQPGGPRFAVMVVLVDQRAPSAALDTWRQNFARPDWRVVADPGGRLSSAVGLRLFDTKYLLDGRGQVLDITTTPVDGDYLRLLRERTSA